MGTHTEDTEANIRKQQVNIKKARANTKETRTNTKETRTDTKDIGTHKSKKAISHLARQNPYK